MKQSTNRPASRRPNLHQSESGEVAAAANNQVVAQCWLDVMERLTVESLVRLYVADASKRTNVPETRSALRSRARLLLAREVVIDGERRRLGDLEIAELLPIHCTQLLTTSTKAANTINAQVGLLRTAFRWAAAVGLWDGQDPTRALKYRKAPSAERALSDQMVRFVIYGLDVAEVVIPEELEWIDFARILLCEGLRPGDLRTTLTADVDLDRRWITCRQKGDRRLEVPFPPALDRVMARRVEAARGRKYLFAAFSKGAHHKTRVATRPIHKDQSRTVWRESILPVLADLTGARERAGLSTTELAMRIGCTRERVEAMEQIQFDGTDQRGRRVTLAYFRATNVTTKIRRGASTKHAGASVGHESERTTQAYVGPLFDQLEGVAALMDEYFADGKTSTNTNSTPDDPLEKIVGRNLKRLREARRLSQGDLGERLAQTGKGYSDRTVREWETQGLADLRLIGRVAVALDCDRAALLEGVA